MKTGKSCYTIPYDQPDALQVAEQVIQRGGILVYPTDTLYGFGVDATNDKAIDKLNQLKGRSGPMSVIAADMDMVRSWTNLSPPEFDQIKTYLGGSTTVIIPIKANITGKHILGPDNTLGIRIPDHPFGPALVAKLGKPITTTSVNKTGLRPLHEPEKIMDQFGCEIDLLVDGGTLPESAGSTIYKLIEGRIVTIRS